MFWIKNDDYIFGQTVTVTGTGTESVMPSFEGKSLACFDLDDTITESIYTNKTIGNTDVILLNIDIKNRLKSYIDKNYSIIIITNQKGIVNGKMSEKDFLDKIEKLQVLLDIDFAIFIALSELYRKPLTTIWDKFINGDKTTSFYCGDAGGLEKRKIGDMNIVKDFSDTDLKFAKNIGIKFLHRDEFVYDQDYPKGLPTDYSNKIWNVHYVDFSFLDNNMNNQLFKPSNNKEMIINVGFPGSGKTHYTKNNILIHNYVHINQDTLKTEKKCLQTAESVMKKNKQSLVIDNTNMTVDKRKLYIDLAKKYGYAVRCFLFTTPIEICKHNNHYRHVMTNGETKLVPAIAYNIASGKFTGPDLNENIDEIVKIDFSFTGDLDKYKKYYY